MPSVEAVVQTQSSQLHVEALAVAACTGLGAAILAPLWSRGQMLDLSELDHQALSHDPDYKEIVMLLTRHERIGKLRVASCLGLC